MATKESDVPVHFVSRVSLLPMVALVLDSFYATYNKVKDSPIPLLGRTLNAAEATAKFAADKTLPIAAKPIGFFDNIACKGLDVVEVTFPVVKRPPGEIVADAKAYLAVKAQPTVDLLANVKAFGADKVGSAAEFGKDKIVKAAKIPNVQKALTQMDVVLTTADSYVDKYIPASEEERSGEAYEGFDTKAKIEATWDPALAPIAHAAALTNKLRRRIFHLVLLKAQGAQKTYMSAFDRIHPIEFVDYVRHQLSSGSQALAEKTNMFWKETTHVMTPGGAAQAMTSGVTYVETRVAETARKVYNYLSLTYKKTAKQIEEDGQKAAEVIDEQKQKAEEVIG
jgi:hypothetical protein